MCSGPAASAGAEPARVPSGLQVQVEPEGPAPAQAGSAGLGDAGAGIQQLPAGRRVEEGTQLLSAETTATPLHVNEAALLHTLVSATGSS